jgi:hypothetical protein
MSSPDAEYGSDVQLNEIEHAEFAKTSLPVLTETFSSLSLNLLKCSYSKLDPADKEGHGTVTVSEFSTCSFFQELTLRSRMATI